MVQSARSRTVLTLYTTADDIQCHRARLVLAAKGVSYERVLVDPAKPPEDLLDLNPYGSTPTLVDRDLTLYDTAVVCEYLDERYPHPPLMPIDPLSRARLRLATVRIERDWLPEVDTIRAGGRPADAARKRLREHLLASLPLFKAAKFFLNPEMSLVDCLVAPVVWRLPWLGVDLGREGKPIVDYGERLFHSQGYARSLTSEERAMRP
ncbi:glutathione S-transferase N-terminal domain-containing protein [Frateuria sp. MAH-13]|uniref:Glutathione S-transferase N-terminal domain-containing protein n=1 Tax=Frateuria flava TaxID=2821489 RepID=A0ABS4DNR0_9GAMM|nr:glutathione S-transferase N-terminal domain-containing protein [Frateuria flava]MBP1474697.1 glutathione S-transferase N-terminal domain-containing protein [Frateuria flava]